MFELDFNICQKGCDQLFFSDLTGQYVENLSDCCQSGYGYSTNPTQDQVVATQLEVTYPNGNVYNITNVELGYLPPVSACDSFILTATQGAVALIADGISIGTAIFISDIAQLNQDLVNSVNAGTCNHNYHASYNGATGEITICDVCSGEEANGKTIDVCVWMMTTNKDELTLSGGLNTDNCFTFGKGLIEGTGVDDCFDDGVYKFKWDVTINDGEEDTVYSVTKYFVFDCKSHECLRELILLSTSKDCPCNDKEIHRLIQDLRTDIESATINWEECHYDCANETLARTQKACENVCLDC